MTLNLSVRAGGPGLQNPAVLIVDDEPDLVDILTLSFLKSGFAVHSATTGEEALGVLSSQPISLIITDVNMPVTDGQWLLRQLADSNAAIPVIVMTGVSLQRGELSSPHIKKIVRKPFSREELIAAARLVISQNPVPPVNS